MSRYHPRPEKDLPETYSKNREIKSALIKSHTESGGWGPRATCLQPLLYPVNPVQVSSGGP